MMLGQCANGSQLGRSNAHDPITLRRAMTLRANALQRILKHYRKTKLYRILDVLQGFLFCLALGKAARYFKTFGDDVAIRSGLQSHVQSHFFCLYRVCPRHSPTSRVGFLLLHPLPAGCCFVAFVSVNGRSTATECICSYYHIYSSSLQFHICRVIRQPENQEGKCEAPCQFCRRYVRPTQNWKAGRGRWTPRPPVRIRPRTFLSMTGRPRVARLSTMKGW